MTVSLELGFRVWHRRPDRHYENATDMETHTLPSATLRDIDALALRHRRDGHSAGIDALRLDPRVVKVEAGLVYKTPETDGSAHFCVLML